MAYNVLMTGFAGAALTLLLLIMAVALGVLGEVVEGKNPYMAFISLKIYEIFSTLVVWVFMFSASAITVGIFLLALFGI